MSEANFEINKQKQNMSFNESFNESYIENPDEKLNSIISKNDNSLIITDNKKSAVSGLEDKMEESFIIEKKVSKSRKESPENESEHIGVKQRSGQNMAEDTIEVKAKHIGFDQRYTRIVTTDNIMVDGKKKKVKVDDIGMMDVRRKLRYYFDSVASGNQSEQRRNLQRLIKECDNYCRGKFYIFKWGRQAGERLKEVKQLKRDAQRKLDTMPRKINQSDKINLIVDEERNTGQTYINAKETCVNMLRFLIENPIRIGLSVLTMPVWIINEYIRFFQGKLGFQQNRSIKIPWMHRWIYYAGRQYYKRKTGLFSLSGHRSFMERFFLHRTDYAAMDRADKDTAMANDDADYDDDDLDFEEESAQEKKSKKKAKKQ